MSATQKTQSFIDSILPWNHSDAPTAKKLPGVFGIVTVENHKNSKRTWMQSHRMNLRGGKGSVQERLPRILNKYEGQDVYFETGLKNPDKIKARTKTNDIRGKRGTADEVAAVLFFSLDIDCAAGDHANGNLPPRHKALGFLRYDCPFQPSMVVDSGGGYHAYWLLKTPYIIETKDEQRNIEAYKKGFQSFISEEFKHRGWHLDNVSDLSRVLRLPGTSNTKYPGHVVDFEFFDNEPWNFGDVRFSVSDFEPFKILVKEHASYEGDKYNPDISIKGTATGKAKIIDAIRQVCAEAGQIHLDKRLPLTGWLLRSGVDASDVFDIILAGTCHHRARIDGIENAEAVARSCVDGTLEKFEAGKPVTGFPKLAESIGEDNAAKIGALVFEEYQEQEGRAELKAFIEKLKTIRFDNSAHLDAEKAKATELQARRASFKQSSPRLQRIFRKFAEKNEELCWDLIRCFEVQEVCNLPADLFEEAFKGMGLGPEWLEDARAKPLNLEDKKAIRKTSRMAYLALKSNFWSILEAFAECIAQPLLDTIRHLEVFQSVHISDKGFMEFIKFASPNYANKIEGLNNCATTIQKKTLDDVTSEDHGKEISKLIQTCHSSKCSGCQGFYIQQQYGYLRDSKDLWVKKMLTVRIAAEEDTPEATVKVWKSIVKKMRGFEFRGAVHPTFDPLGIKAGLFFVMEDIPEAKQALRKAFPDSKIVSMDGKQALHDFSFMVNLSALRNREMIVLKDEALSTNKWLGRVKYARNTGRCEGFKWRSMRAWQEFRTPAAEETADTRPCKISLVDILSGEVFYEASSKDPPPNFYDSCKLKNSNEVIQRAEDARIIAQLGQLKGGLIVSKRRAIREYQAAMKSGAEILDTMIC